MIKIIGDGGGGGGGGSSGKKKFSLTMCPRPQGLMKNSRGKSQKRLNCCRGKKKKPQNQKKRMITEELGGGGIRWNYETIQRKGQRWKTMDEKKENDEKKHVAG